MPLIYVNTRRRVSTTLEGGTQYVDGVLSFAGGTTIYLAEAVFSATGQYVLFDYSAGSFPGGQAQLDANVIVNTDDLVLSGAPVLTDDPANERILLDLNSRPTNGKQFVEGDLTFAGSTTMILGATMYATAGTYELFEVTGTITGVNNLTCVSAAGLSAGTPFVDGNLVKVTLV
jgi:hypothetical protein